ncbi:UvrD-like helicase C-terminal domain-containing protein [Selenomonas ruminantium]|uniref:UvrD-like helicase C-terminal domain-containing protein n=1 Tax=Selenomonas ruminantium TaxID=971 RepID=A0A1M6X2X7_SELRU|nr:UvrD-helicase domain-containing protein [Selenomonas ruminantium]SHL00286.1 UvrD-like helicase C-terminal domain-containing protein [Selenomonas ruminantium]
MRASSEQIEIIKASQELQLGQVMKIDACAGSGKTSTLVAVANANPQKRFLYLAFNRSIADKANQVFPANTRAMTMHSMAYRHFFSRGARPTLAAIKVDMLHDCFPHKENYELFLLLSRYKEFLISAEHDFPNGEIKKIFELVAEGILPMPHDHYLKLFQMLSPEEQGLGRIYDCILVDESQDCNPVTLSIINRASCSRIFVGDSHQSIYGFRGAINALARQKADVTLHLTNSFRARQPILDRANLYMTVFMDMLYDGQVPYYPMNSMINEDKLKNKQIACITRTNSALVDLIDEYREKPERVYLVKKPDDVFKAAIAVKEFLFDRRNDFVGEFKFLNRLHGKEELQDYAESTADVEILSAMKIAENYEDDLYELLDIARRMNNPDASVVLTNAHTSKGLEWHTVKLMDDFPDLGFRYMSCRFGSAKLRSGMSHLEQQDERFKDFIQELNLYYVAITRAQIKLVDMTENAAYQSRTAILEHLDECEAAVRKARDRRKLRKDIEHEKAWEAQNTRKHHKTSELRMWETERDTVLNRMRKNIKDCAVSANNFKEFKDLLSLGGILLQKRKSGWAYVDFYGRGITDERLGKEFTKDCIMKMLQG